MISATVSWSCVGSPPYSGESIFGEGSVKLNDQIPLLSHWNVHWSCNSLCVDLQFSPLGSSWCVICLMICWNVNLICVSLTLKIYRMVVNVIYCNLWSGRLKNFYVWMICDEANMVHHSEINGCKLYRWSVSIMSCSCGGCNYPNVCDLEQPLYELWWLSCNVCKNGIVTWINFACPCLHSGVMNLIWHGGFWKVWFGDDLLGFLKEVSCVGNPWQCDHIHHTHSI